MGACLYKSHHLLLSSKLHLGTNANQGRYEQALTLKQFALSSPIMMNFIHSSKHHAWGRLLNLMEPREAARS